MSAQVGGMSDDQVVETLRNRESWTGTGLIYMLFHSLVHASAIIGDTGSHAL